MRMPHLSIEIYEDLKAKIVSGVIPSGRQLIENQLTVQYHASRTPVRQALSRLEKEGLVYSIPHKGTFARHLTHEDVMETYEAGEALEGMAAFLYASREKPDVSQLRSLNDEMKQTLAADDPARWCTLEDRKSVV